MLRLISSFIQAEFTPHISANRRNQSAVVILLIMRSCLLDMDLRTMCFITLAKIAEETVEVKMVILELRQVIMSAALRLSVLQSKFSSSFFKKDKWV